MSSYFKFPGSSPLKGSNPLKGLNKTFKSISDYISTSGNSDLKAFRSALIEGDEAKALQCYLTDNKGHSLQEDLNPSAPFSISKYSNQTPLHLAALSALKLIAQKFLDYGGTPCVTNSDHQTCLHCVCNNSDKQELRTEMLEIFINWSGPEIDGRCESVSINHVDNDGNTALHYAALNNLTGCISKLLSCGAIISIVNKDQKNCCELADMKSHKQLSDALELAILYQKEDSSMEIFNAGLQYTHENHPAVYIVDAKSMTNKEISHWMNNIIYSIAEEYNLPTHRAEALLDHYSWSVSSLKKDLDRKDDSRAAIEASGMVVPVVPCIFHPISSSSSSSPSSSSFRDTNPPGLSAVSSASASASDCNRETSSVDKLNNVQPEPSENDSNSYSNSSSINMDFNTPISLSKSASQDKLDVNMPTPTVFNFSSNITNSTAIIPESASPAFGFNTPCIICGETFLPSITPENIIKYQNLEDFDVLSRSVQCDSGHKFCLSCWRTQLQMKVKEDTVKCLQCPAFKCGDRLNLDDWAEAILVHDELIQRLYLSRSNFVVDCCNQYRRCPGEDCDLVICYECDSDSTGNKTAFSFNGDAHNSFSNIPSVSETGPIWGKAFRAELEASAASSSSSSSSSFSLKAGSDINSNILSLDKSVLCSNGHSFCLSCNGTAHAPCSCSVNKKWKDKVSKELKRVDGANSGADVANALWLAANCKNCPRCKTPIEKDEGCNHMSCRKCRYEFCWICMQNWGLHSNNTGGYFQCNRFVENNEDPTSMKLQEYGNAHAESQRTRAKGKTMAKFIHYYTRYSAHRDSAELENKIRKETVMRIKISLSKSDQGGDLEWLQRGEVQHPYSDLSVDDAKSFKFIDDDIEIFTNSVENTPSSILPDLTTPKTSKRFSFAKTFLFRTPESKKNKPLNTSKSSDVKEIGSELSKKLILSGGDPLTFLSEGFLELLRCRKLLQGSFPFAFYFFELDAEDLDVDEFDDINIGLNLEKGVISSQKHGFEQLQSELESFVEMLSDVVARKRLRASKSQIIQATRSAKSKRIEMEEFIKNINFLLSESNFYVPKKYHHPYSPSSSRKVSHQSGGLTARRRREHPSLLQERSEQDLEIAAIIHMIELENQKARTKQPDSEEAFNQIRMAEDRIRLRQIKRSTSSRKGKASETSSSNNLLSPSTGALIRSFGFEMQEEPRQDPNSFSNFPQKSRDDDPDIYNSLQSSTISPSMPSSPLSGENQSSQKFSPRKMDLLPSPTYRSTRQKEFAKHDDDDDDDDDDSDAENETGLQSNHLLEALGNIQFDDSDQKTIFDLEIQEQEALNRAILMSLQSQPSPSNFKSQEVEEQDVRPRAQPSDSNVSLLVSMGFSDEQAHQALIETFDNLDQAIDKLINS